jgi:hypothetical protein
MAIEPFVGLIAGIIVGGAAGAMSSFIGWLASNEPFQGRKFSVGLITGIMAGLGLTFLNLALLKGAADEYELATLLFTIAIAAMGSDYARERLGTAISNKPANPPKTNP